MRVTQVLTLHLRDPENECLLKFCPLGTLSLESNRNRTGIYTILGVSDSSNVVP